MRRSSRGCKLARAERRPQIVYPVTPYEDRLDRPAWREERMATRKNPAVSDAAFAFARKRAEQTCKQLHDKPAPAEILTPGERDNAAPFYFVLREYIRQLKEAREAAGLTLADVSARTGITVESLSRPETGAQTNPTWKTLGLYAAALGRGPRLEVEVADEDDDMGKVG